MKKLLFTSFLMFCGALFASEAVENDSAYLPTFQEQEEEGNLDASTSTKKVEENTEDVTDTQEEVEKVS